MYIYESGFKPVFLCRVVFFQLQRKLVFQIAIESFFDRKLLISEMHNPLHLTQYSGIING